MGYEDEVEEISNEITDEVYNYLILRKKEQTNIEDQAEGYDNNGGIQTSIEDEDQQIQGGKVPVFELPDQKNK